MSTTAAPMTVDEFLKLPEVEGRKNELIHGEVVSMAYAGFDHERVKSNLIQILAVWLSQRALGKLFAETTYRLDAEVAVMPDLSVLRNERLTPVTGDLPTGAPDLAIEVVSSESAAHLRSKIQLYLKHGTKGVWAIYPGQLLVEVHNANNHVAIFECTDALEDRAALPGFSIPVSAIFEGL
jgi:Uma2 family endonuclease